MHTELAGLVGCGGDNTTLMLLPTDNYGLSFQRKIEELLDRDKESVHVYVKDRSGVRRHGANIYILFFPSAQAGEFDFRAKM